MTPTPVNFLDWVQHHERSWGSKNYVGRPSLAQILAAPVVTFWKVTGERGAEQYMVRLYNDLNEIEAYFVKLFMRYNADVPKERLAIIFVGQKRYRIRRVKIEFEEAPS